MVVAVGVSLLAGIAVMLAWSCLRRCLASQELDQAKSRSVLNSEKVTTCKLFSSTDSSMRRNLNSADFLQDELEVIRMYLTLYHTISKKCAGNSDITKYLMLYRCFGNEEKFCAIVRVAD